MTIHPDVIPRLEELAAALEALAGELEAWREDGVVLTPQAIIALVHALTECWGEAACIASTLKGERPAVVPTDEVVSLTQVRARRQIADWLRTQGLRAAWDADGPRPGGDVA